MESKNYATVSIGVQSFEKLRMGHTFYIDKTAFIKEWWEQGDDVTLITRPRRFGKTLNMSMVECFFSNKYAGRGDLFEGLSIWEDETYRQLQGTYPVIFLSFASVKTGKVDGIKAAIKKIVTNAYNSFRPIMESAIFDGRDRTHFYAVDYDMDDGMAYASINNLCIYLEKYYGKDAIILLDEYDTPMQEAWLAGTWDEAVEFFRNFFNATFKTNTHMHKGIATGITRISKESIFSDLNHLQVITTTSDFYATSFGFTEKEVFRALDDMGLGAEKQGVKRWYDGFTFGSATDIYNPWSIISFLKSRGKYEPYWVDSSGNSLANSLIQKGPAGVKRTMEELLRGNPFTAELHEQIVFNQLGKNQNAIWSLLLATGYLRVENVERVGRFLKKVYTLRLTNLEIEGMFVSMVNAWFETPDNVYNDFVTALLMDDVDSMNEFMNKIALQSFSSFDAAKNASCEDHPERFYHGFVLGLMVGLDGRFAIISNRESGFGRYDVMLEPTNKEKDNAYIIEFKVRKPRKEKSLEETLANALAQIEEKKYEASLTAKGILPGRIRKYGFAFEGKSVLIGTNDRRDI